MKKTEIPNNLFENRKTINICENDEIDIDFIDNCVSTPNIIKRHIFEPLHSFIKILNSDHM